MAEKPSGLALLREPFAENHISKLPKPTKAQTEAVKNDFKAGIRCKLCGSWHHPDVVHLDYVGHAALTDRLLDVDPEWSWEPMAFHDGLPAFDKTGGLWIKLTVCGVSRLGYGHAASKPGQDPGAREKEVIGDALRNAAMRFGAALDLWHKGDLHGDSDADTQPQEGAQQQSQGEPSGQDRDQKAIDALFLTIENDLKTSKAVEALTKAWKAHAADLKKMPKGYLDELTSIAAERKAALLKPAREPGDDYESDIPFGDRDPRDSLNDQFGHAA